jgi:hypothetical protein
MSLPKTKYLYPYYPFFLIKPSTYSILMVCAMLYYKLVACWCTCLLNYITLDIYCVPLFVGWSKYCTYTYQHKWNIASPVLSSRCQAELAALLVSVRSNSRRKMGLQQSLNNELFIEQIPYIQLDATLKDRASW